MKRNIRISILGLAMVLSSCGKSNTSPSVEPSKNSNASISSLPSTSGKESPNKSSAISPSTSDTTSPSLPSADTTPSDIYELIQSASENTNFTILDSYQDSTGADVEYSTFYTKDYIYYQYSDAGYVSLESYDGNGTQLYNFSKRQAVELEDAVFYTDPDTKEATPIKKTETLNPLIDGIKNVTAASFETNGRYYYCKDSVLIEAFAYFLGASDFVGSMAAVTFSLSTSLDSLEFGFAPNFKGSDSDTSLIDSLHGELFDVGNTSVPELDSYHSSYILPTTKLSDDLLLSLADEMSYSTKVVYSYQGNKEDVIEQEDDIILTNSVRQITRHVSKIVSPTYSYLTKDSTNQNAIDNYISYDNKIIKEDTGEKFDSLVKKPRSLFEKDAFRLMDDGKTYHYFGYKGRSLIEDLTGFDTGNLKSIDVVVEEGKIKSLHAITPLRKDTYSQTMYYDVTVEFQKTSTIKPLVCYPESDSDTNPVRYNLSKAISNFGFDFGSIFYSFTATMSTKNTNNYKTTLKAFKQKESDYEMDTLLFDKEFVDTSTGSMGDKIHVQTGYYKKDNSTIIPFKVVDGKAVSSGPNIKGNLGTILGFDISADIFDVKDTNDSKSYDHTYQARTEAKNLSGHFLGYDNQDSMIPSSLTIHTGSSQSAYGTLAVIDSIEYEFNGEDIYKGKDVVSFTDYDKTKAPTDIDFSTLKDWVEPKTWKEGVSSEISEKIDSSLGDGMSSKIPFLYDKEMEDNWEIDCYDNTTDMSGKAISWINLFNMTYAVSDNNARSDYLTKYATLLKDNGFVEKQYPLANLGQGTQLYSETLDLYCRIADSVSSGIRFLKYID